MRAFERLVRATLRMALMLLTSCDLTNTSWQFGGPSCDEFNCVWQAELGSIERTDSWHEHAYAYRLAGSPARLTRRLDLNASPGCFELELTANVAADARFEVQFDFGDDGMIDVRTTVPTSHWQRRLFYLRAPASVRHLRVLLDKQGPGDVVIQFIALNNGEDHCADQPPTTLANGSRCLDDASCTSGYCVLGTCSACGAGGCADGSPCKEGKDCSSGACAAGVCRSCAADGSCSQGEGCSANAQCASGSCIFGSRPSLIAYPERDGVCGECDADTDCASGHCLLGACASCATNADCPDGQRCRYTDAVEAKVRSCLPRFDAILPRGALCEEDAECTSGLSCGGAPGRAKRCGFACGNSADCPNGQVCADPGSLPSNTSAGIYERLPAYDPPAGRVTTCYPPIAPDDWRTPCSVHAQCRPAPYATARFPNAFGVCCGSCTEKPIDLESGTCDESYDYDFLRFY